MINEIKIKEMIKKYRTSRNLSQDDLGSILNVSGKTISSWESGRTEPNMGFVQQLADFFSITTDEMIYGNSRLSELNIIYDDYFPLHYSTNLSAGSLEELLDSEPDAIVYIPIKYQSKKKRLHAFKINGDSMNNVFEDGSIVISEDVGHISKLKDGTIVVAWSNGGATVKRLYNEGNMVILMPDSTNKTHKAIYIDTSIDTVNIIGRVIWHMNPDDMEERY